MASRDYLTVVKAAARLYRPAGRYPYYFALGKLGLDPVFPALLSRGLIGEGARILDLGCGQGVLGALLVAAQSSFQTNGWPADWPTPPHRWSLRGIELQDRLAGWGRLALRERAQIETGDLRIAQIPDADVVVILDVLHYLDPNAQNRVLEQIARSLRGGGMLLLRVGDARAGFRFRFTRWADSISTLCRGQGLPAHHCRTTGDWRAALEALGFTVQTESMSRGTPFANVLLIARC